MSIWVIDSLKIKTYLSTWSYSLQEPILIMIPAMDISAWTPEDLTEALRSPTTKSSLIPYLEKANIVLKEALEKGELKVNIYSKT